MWTSDSDYLAQFWLSGPWKLVVWKNSCSQFLICFIGINPTIDAARKSFPLLAEAIEALRPVAEANKENVLLLNDASLDELLECVSTADKYYKSHYSYNLGKTSLVASHCIECAVACSKKPSLFGRGCGQKHTEVCEYCQLVPNIVRVLERYLNWIEEEQLLPLLKIQVPKFKKYIS